MNKEIEKLLDCSNCKFATCEQCEISYTDKKIIREYIEQLESDKQKLIEKLEEDIEIAKKQYSENTLLNIRIDGKLDTLEEILEIVKGENNE